MHNERLTLSARQSAKRLTFNRLAFDSAWAYDGYDRLWGNGRFRNLPCMVCSSPRELLLLPAILRIEALLMAQ